MKNKNGDEFEGEWENDFFSKGEIKYNNGDYYSGTYRINDEKMNGRMKYNNGDEYIGEWKKSKKEGNFDIK